jgi:hypothetical protein
MNREERLAEGATGWLTCEQLAKKKAQQAPVGICQPLAIGVGLEERPVLQVSYKHRTKISQNLQKKCFTRHMQALRFGLLFLQLVWRGCRRWRFFFGKAWVLWQVGAVGFLFDQAPRQPSTLSTARYTNAPTASNHAACSVERCTVAAKMLDVAVWASWLSVLGLAKIERAGTRPTVSQHGKSRCLLSYV